VSPVLLLTPNRTSSHLNPEILAIRLVACPWDLAIVNADGADIAPGPEILKAQHLSGVSKLHEVPLSGSYQCITVSHQLDHAVSTTSIRALLDPLLQSLHIRLIIPRLGTELLRNV
jgi:hypothetical protein